MTARHDGVQHGGFENSLDDFDSCCRTRMKKAGSVYVSVKLKHSIKKKTAFSTNGAGITGGYHVEECELIHS